MKLKQLKLAGFKSFADKTTFDFHEGISCIVGPNGCGKSNVVDAIKWVLGEQSAKSLRGSEMQDVIFNGSVARKSSGVAEVTLVFDNSDGLVIPPVQGDAPEGEVSITRRLYRSGQSEYLINKVAARLRDIREMFMDTGIGTDGYGVIEQGRVEMFLNASTEDRRQIFDEAAGISKYKARKKEALRKLDRVEQNLFRLNDVLAEIERRLRSVKLQAGKARNYTTYTQQLNELKSLFYLAQYHQFHEQRQRFENRIAERHDELKLRAKQTETLRETRRGVEVELGDLDRLGRELQGELSGIDGKVHAGRQRVEMLEARVEELGQQIIVASRRCEELETKLDALAQQRTQAEAQSEELQTQAATLAEQHAAARTEADARQQRIAELQVHVEQAKDHAMDLMRQVGQLQTAMQADTVKHDTLTAQGERLAARLTELAASSEQLEAIQNEDQQQFAAVTSQIEADQAKLDEARQQASQAAERHQALQHQLNDIREQRSGVVSRMEALEEMLQRLEGVGSGTREVLAAARDGALAGIRGMLGDLIDTDVEHAPLVEAALAGADQTLLADSWSQVDVDTLDEMLGETGAVEVLALDRLGVLRGDFDPDGVPGLQGRVMDCVRFAPWLSRVMWRLLGRTLIVETLADAATASQATPAGYRFVTRSGDVWEADGRIRLGSAHRASGVITRRSELADLEQRRVALDEQLESLTGETRGVAVRRDELEETISQVRSAVHDGSTRRVELQSHLSQLDEQLKQVRREQPVVEAERNATEEELQVVSARRDEAQAQLTQLESQSAERQQTIEHLTEQLKSAEQAQQAALSTLTELKVTIGQVEEKRVALVRSVESLDAQQDHMQRDLAGQRHEIELSRQRRQEAEATIGQTRDELTTMQQRQHQLRQDVADHESSRKSLSDRLDEIRHQGEAYRKQDEAIKEQIHGIQVEQADLNARIEALVSKASDELHMVLPELFADYEHDAERNWNEVEAEIHELRGKIERLGNVNLDAITEQEELEERHAFQTEQLSDINESQAKLIELIDRLNVESHQRFVETFGAVRVNFQELFRKLFGGGKADLILLDEENPLESGIEIVARPPGKELRSLTLLSGGEKAKTALALIFSFFRSRPSPFCLLDEVDAPLDESNTEQFARMLREFTDETQFIVISHAKRTMSMVDILYGVTMQEPGVSVPVAVKFDDVHEFTESAEPVAAG